MACKILSCGIKTLSGGMLGLVPQLGIEPGPLALGAQSLSHWNTRETPYLFLSIVFELSHRYSEFHLRITRIYTAVL